MDILTFTALQRMNKSGFNRFFDREPKFAFYSAVSAVSAMIDFYGDRETVPMNTFQRGSSLPEQPNGVSAFSTTEFSQNGNQWFGNSSSEASSNGYTPASGYVGLSSHSNLFCGAADFSTETDIGSSSEVYNTMNVQGIVLGENAAYKQGINLMKSGAQIILDWADNRFAGLGNSVANRFSWTSLVGLNRLASAQNTGLGDIAYNRLTGTVAFIESVGGTTYNYRIHIFKNLPKLSNDALALKAAMEAAIAGQSGMSYETFDFTWNGTNNTEWHLKTMIIPCDDGTFWLSRMAPNSGLFLASITGASGSRVFNSIRNVPVTTSYGADQGTMYGARHMISDNEKFVAVYCPYYYYVCGGCFLFLPRDSAAQANRHGYLQIGDSSRGYSIAPFGGSSFIIGRAINMDGRAYDGSIVDLDRQILTSTAAVDFSTAMSWTTTFVHGYSSSTMYGGNGFIKVKPTRSNMTEWLERTA